MLDYVIAKSGQTVFRHFIWIKTSLFFWFLTPKFEIKIVENVKKPNPNKSIGNLQNIRDKS